MFFFNWKTAIKKIFNIINLYNPHIAHPMFLRFLSFSMWNTRSQQLYVYIHIYNSTIRSIEWRLLSSQVTITGFDLSSYRQSLIRWNHAISVMYGQCKELGPERCLMVPYEQLVLHPRQWMKKILNYLDVPWNESVMHHEEFINKPGGVPLSK